MIRAVAEGRKSERDGASARAEAGWRDATRRAELTATSHRPRAPRGNAAARPSRTPARRSYQHSRCTENGGSEKERIPFRRAGGDEKRRSENERARDKERRADERQWRGWRGKGREDKRAKRERGREREILRARSIGYVKLSARSLEISGKRLVHSECVYVRRPHGFYLSNAFVAPRYSVVVIIAIVVGRRNRFVSSFHNFLGGQVVRDVSASASCVDHFYATNRFVVAKMLKVIGN